MPLLVVGSIALDTITTADDRVDEVLGGSAVYASVAAAYFTTVRMVSVAGKDLGAAPLTRLRRRGIDVSGVEVRAGKTFRWAAKYSDDLNQRTTLSTQLNVFESFNPKIRRADVGVPFLFLGNLDPDLQRRILIDVKPGMSACDTMNFWIDGKSDSIKRLLTGVDGLLLNDSEARLLAGEMNSVAAARRLLDLGLKFLVVKQGEFGAALYAAGCYFSIPAYPVEKPIDPTGAGDSFAGGFLGHLARIGRQDTKTLREAMLYGSALASFCVEDFSLRRFDAIDLHDIEGRFKELRSFVSLGDS